MLGGLSREYSGSPVEPTVVTNPPGLPVSFLYRDLSPTAPVDEPHTVFNNFPPVLPLSFSSLSFGGGVSSLGNYIKLGGTARKLQSCEVILVTWARAARYPAWAALNAAGYLHPVTITLYSVSPENVITTLTTLTRNIPVPWRPETLPDGSIYPFNGYAFPASFDFADGISLPEQIMVAVDYDTQSSGFTPIGQRGPYNELNVALGGGEPLVGADVDPDVVLRVTSDAWYYPNTGWSDFNGPITRLRARNTVTTTAPTAPGAYQVTALAGTTGTEGTALGTLTIAAPSLEKWQNTLFTEAQRLAGESLPQQDADGDGLTNLVEYALGTSPHGSSGEPPWTIDPAGLTITLDRPRWLTGVGYVAEESPDMAHWFPVALDVVSSTATRETVRAAASAGAAASPRTFLRIRFTE